MIFSFDIFFYIAEEYMHNNLNFMRVQYELEYSLNCSPKVLFSRLSTPEGLSEWFAEDVTSDGETFTFHWNKIQYTARLVALKENKLVRFEWTDQQDNDSNFFEFKINGIQFFPDGNVFFLKFFIMRIQNTSPKIFKRLFLFIS